MLGFEIYSNRLILTKNKMHYCISKRMIIKYKDWVKQFNVKLVCVRYNTLLFYLVFFNNTENAIIAIEHFESLLILDKLGENYL